MKQGQVFEGVASLIDKSLLQQTEQEGEEPRLVMLETIREYGLEALAASGKVEATRQAHAAYYLSWQKQRSLNSLVHSKSSSWNALSESMATWRLLCNGPWSRRRLPGSSSASMWSLA